MIDLQALERAGKRYRHLIGNPAERVRADHLPTIRSGGRREPDTFWRRTSTRVPTGTLRLMSYFRPPQEMSVTKPWVKRIAGLSPLTSTPSSAERPLHSWCRV